jgi:hypothetical protein
VWGSYGRKIIGPACGSSSDVLAGSDVDDPDRILLLGSHQEPVAVHVSPELSGRSGKLDLSELRTVEAVQDEQRSRSLSDVEAVARG